MTVGEFFAAGGTMLLGRTTGPLTLRLILQPSMAALLAIRAGLKDAREGRTPYLWSIVKARTHRASLIRDGWNHVRTPFLVSFALDVVYQIIVFRWVYLGQAVIVGTVLAAVPFLVLRGVTTRLAGLGHKPPSLP